MLKRLFKRNPEPRDAEADDPRGGLQSDEYRHSRPEDVVEEGGVTMGGPGGAPVPDASVEERRDRDRPDDSAA